MCMGVGVWVCGCRCVGIGGYMERGGGMTILVPGVQVAHCTV